MSTVEIREENGNTMNENYTYDGTTYTYTDKNSGKQFLWDLEKNSWIEKNKQNSQLVTNGASEIKQVVVDELKGPENDVEENDSDEESVKPKAKTQDMSKGVYGYEGDTYTYTDSTDGTVYFWDKQKNAWFPKIDDDFIAIYQMSYGFTTPSEGTPAEKLKEVNVSENKDNQTTSNTEESNVNLKRKPEPECPKWFQLDDQHNTKVYVTNLPLDITETEFVDLMQKCGLVMKDIDTGTMKIKLYTDPITKTLKGDALCTYIKKESVDLALNLLDGYDVRGSKIKVEKAQFTMKGDAYDPNLKPKKRRKKDKEKLKKMQEKLFAWQPDKLRGMRPKHERVVIVKNLFEPSTFDENLSLILEYQQDLREECSKCGSVKKVVIYDKHPEGVAQISFKEAEAADACIQLLNNRWFSKRLLTAETWDGKTRYKIQETPEETEVRLKKWEEFLNLNKENSTEKSKDESSAAYPANDNEAESDETRSSAGSDDETDEENAPK